MEGGQRKSLEPAGRPQSQSPSTTGTLLSGCRAEQLRSYCSFPGPLHSVGRWYRNMGELNGDSESTHAFLAVMSSLTKKAVELVCMNVHMSYVDGRYVCSGMVGCCHYGCIHPHQAFPGL